MIRVCDECGTRLLGKRGHGFVKRGKLVCGQRFRERSVRQDDGTFALVEVETPRCAK